jgi:hypothetical protein
VTGNERRDQAIVRRSDANEKARPVDFDAAQTSFVEVPGSQETGQDDLSNGPVRLRGKVGVIMSVLARFSLLTKHGIAFSCREDDVRRSTL